MKKLCKVELMILKQYGLLEEEKIEKEEYDNILNKIPYYVFCRDGNYYKYVVSQDVTDELIQQLERATSLDLQIENNENIKSIKEDIYFFKSVTIVLLILAFLVACYIIFSPMLNV